MEWRTEWPAAAGCVCPFYCTCEWRGDSWMLGRFHTFIAAGPELSGRGLFMTSAKAPRKAGRGHKARARCPTAQRTTINCRRRLVRFLFKYTERHPKVVIEFTPRRLRLIHAHFALKVRAAAWNMQGSRELLQRGEKVVRASERCSAAGWRLFFFDGICKKKRGKRARLPLRAAGCWVLSLMRLYRFITPVKRLNFEL